MKPSSTQTSLTCQDPPTELSPQTPIVLREGLAGLALLKQLRWSDRPTTEQAETLRMARPAFERSLTPAEPKAAAVLIEGLRLHYPAQKLNESEAELVAADWLEDFDHVPLDVLEHACRRWRRSPARFAPSPGQLLAFAEPLIEARQVGLRRIDTFLERFERAEKE